MKPITTLLLALSVVIAPVARSQDANAAALERRNQEERYRILSERMTEIENTQNSILKKLRSIQDHLETLEAQFGKAKEDFARGNINLVTADQLRSLVEQVKEVDRKREADKELILTRIKDLAKVPAPQLTESPASQPAPAGEKPEGYWQYKVKKNDSLSAILEGYNADVDAQGYQRITLEQLKLANPKLSRRNYPIEGETLKIPMYPKKKKK